MEKLKVFGEFLLLWPTISLITLARTQTYSANFWLCWAYAYWKTILQTIRSNLKKRIFHAYYDISKCYFIGFEDEKGELKVQKSTNSRFNENEFYFKPMKTPKLVEDIDKNSNEVLLFESTRYQPFASKNCRWGFAKTKLIQSDENGMRLFGWN